MRYLSLFSGAGGGDLAMQHLLGFRCVGYVEYEDYCQRVIRQRIEDGLLDPAPIFGDIRAFNSEGYAESYQGMVDLITGGFPCPAFSTAARGRNIPERDMWPEAAECVEAIKPHLFFGENVQRQAVERAAYDLGAMGYSSSGLPLSTADLGADHIRTRYWILAYPHNKGKLFGALNAEMVRVPGVRPCVWDTYPIKSGMDDGDTHRMDRYKAVGNMQVPIVAATAFRILAGE